MKYVVFKRDEFNDFLKHEPNAGIPNPVSDAAVMRTQDIFCAAGATAYANAIQLAVELHVQSGNGFLEDEQLENLYAARDYFFQVAREAEYRAQRLEAKLPT